MYIYNVTVNLDESAHEDWLKWMKEKHIPDVLNTGCFTENRILKVLVDDEGVTYSVQYHFDTMEIYEKYQKEFAPALQREHSERYANKFVAHRTLLQIV
ncbi:MAG TPA: DUF4286 family protein [Bacteroidia bacterium]|nr:DUF4286 family protein [Bacteroidia bacterium]